MVNYSPERLNSDFKAVEQTLKRYLTYPTNWDEEGAVNFAPRTIETTLTQLNKLVNILHKQQLLPIFEPYPGVEGEVEVTVHSGDRCISLVCQGGFVKILCQHISGESFQTGDILKASVFLCGQ